MLPCLMNIDMPDRREPRPPAGLALSGDEQRRSDPAILSEQKVVCATGGTGVHEFQANAPERQPRHDLMPWKYQPCPGPDQYQFRLQLHQGFHMLEQESPGIGRTPTGDQPVGHDDEIPGMALAGNDDMPGSIGGNPVAIAETQIWFKFHCYSTDFPDSSYLNKINRGVQS